MRSSLRSFSIRPRLSHSRIAALRKPYLPSISPSTRRNVTTMADNAETQLTPEPAKVEEPKKMELPKLTAAEFKAYNRMADMMDYYVGTSAPLNARSLLTSTIAQPLPTDMDNAVQRLHNPETPIRLFNTPVSLSRSRILFPA
jgi:hypothetical protein